MDIELSQALEPPSAQEHLPCKAPFATPMIRRDGRVTVCSMDLAGELFIGSVHESGLGQLWNSPRMKAFRLAHLRGSDELPAICRACPRPDRLSMQETRQWLRDEGLRFELPALIRRSGGRPRLLLVNPPVSERAPYRSVISLGLGYLAAALGDRADVQILDMVSNHFSPARLMDWIERRDFHLVGFTGMTYQGKALLSLGARVRQKFPDRLVLAGGVFASARTEEVLAAGAADLIIPGEGEETLRELVETLTAGGDWRAVPGLIWQENGERRQSGKRTRLDPMRWPVPDRDAMPDRGFIEDPTFGALSCQIMGARGCPGACIFCESPHFFGTTVRARTAESLVEEIRDVQARFGIRYFAIDDDSFTFCRELVLDFCHRLAAAELGVLFRINTRVNLVDEELLQALKHAGCVKVTYGVESGDDAILETLGKGFTTADVRRAFALHRRIGLPAAMLMIIGNPRETEESLRRSQALIRECDPAGGYDFQVMQPHPGTALGDRLHAKYGTVLSRDWDDYYSDNVSFIPHGFTPERFLALARELTGRPVMLAGRHNEATRRDPPPAAVTIDPGDFQGGVFDLLGPHWWAGDETYQQGLAHALGGRQGFIEYHFDLPDPLPIAGASLVVGARLSSQLPRKKGEVICRLNGRELGRAILPEKSATGEWLEFIAEGGKLIPRYELVPRGNRLRFEVPPGPAAAGICIFGQALSHHSAALASTIRVDFRPPAAGMRLIRRIRQGISRRIARFLPGGGHAE